MAKWDCDNLSAPHTQRELAQIVDASAGLLAAKDAEIAKLRRMLIASAAMCSRANEQIDALRATIRAMVQP